MNTKFEKSFFSAVEAVGYGFSEPVEPPPGGSLGQGQFHNYSTFVAHHALTYKKAGMFSDANNDGTPNFFKYAIGANPNSIQKQTGPSWGQYVKAGASVVFSGAVNTGAAGGPHMTIWLPSNENGLTEGNWSVAYGYLASGGAYVGQSSAQVFHGSEFEVLRPLFLAWIAQSGTSANELHDSCAPRFLPAQRISENPGHIDAKIGNYPLFCGLTSGTVVNKVYFPSIFTSGELAPSGGFNRFFLKTAAGTIFPILANTQDSVTCDTGSVSATYLPAWNEEVQIVKYRTLAGLLDSVKDQVKQDSDPANATQFLVKNGGFSIGDESKYFFDGSDFLRVSDSAVCNDLPVDPNVLIGFTQHDYNNYPITFTDYGHIDKEAPVKIELAAGYQFLANPFGKNFKVKDLNLPLTPSARPIVPNAPIYESATIVEHGVSTTVYLNSLGKWCKVSDNSDVSNWIVGPTAGISTLLLTKKLWKIG